MLKGNKNAHHAAKEYFFAVETRALRFIPLTYVGQPCMRVELNSKSLHIIFSFNSLIYDGCSHLPFVCLYLQCCQA